MTSNPNPQLNALDGLKKTGIVVASDTGQYREIAQFHPTDATSNPSLVYAAVSRPEYAHHIDDAVSYAVKTKPGGSLDEVSELAMDKLLVSVGVEILNVVPGRVSISVDPRLGFDHDAILKKAHALVSLWDEEVRGRYPYSDPRARLLIKIPATYPGILAARLLERNPASAGGPIHTNMTLVFGLVQAVACAQAGVSVISPFIGRVKDWWDAREKEERNKAQNASNGPTHNEAGISGIPEAAASGEKIGNGDVKSAVQSNNLADHPGIILVRRIRFAYKRRGYLSHVMAAGFRRVDEIIEIAKGGPRRGPDLVTLPPILLQDLRDKKLPRGMEEFETSAEEDADIKDQLDMSQEPVYISPADGPTPAGNTRFLEDLEQEMIAMDKVPEGLAKFSADAISLQNLLKEKVAFQQVEIGGEVSRKKYALGAGIVVGLMFWFTFR